MIYEWRVYGRLPKMVNPNIEPRLTRRLTPGEQCKSFVDSLLWCVNARKLYMV